MTEENFIGVGAKHDDGKRRWALLPWRALKLVVDVLDHGAKKYGDYSWLEVSNPKERYFSALQRHVIAWHLGEKHDPETGIHHLAHAACNVLFLLHIDTHEPRKAPHEDH